MQSLLRVGYGGYTTKCSVGFRGCYKIMGFYRYFRVCTIIVASLAMVACAETRLVVHTAKRISQSFDEPKKPQDKKAKHSGIYKIGKPYQIQGVWYYPEVNYQYDETGIASWYGPKFHAKKTANGEVFNMNELSAAHRTLPLPSAVRVTNLDNGRSLVLRVNDRGPFAHGRIIDISRRGSQILGFFKQGTARVRVQIMAPESRALAAAMERGPGKKVDTPITVAKLPKPSVTAQSLAPPPGAAVSPASQTAEVNGVRRPETVPVYQQKVVDSGWRPKPESAGQNQVKRTNMYVQAGSYAKFVNANRVRARLSSLGPVKINSVLIGGVDYFRVRVGPVNSVEEADDYLDDVLRAGYNDAKIVIDCLAPGAKPAPKKPDSRSSRIPVSC
ncbi:MAG: septal ring lytic transglycosylase RlpA family protein [Rhodospirillales bacterium]|nr:septal ring lytic transglycosylase RlpA family protein [Rhodospirillales bacterium]MBT3904968.1 septal ring lytic transglycosylase RlpA family protein [Rhodospirillaceae bacterium]MBT5033967.1 septal ring lytic transglycosylase RlpA family protein [Rhodospirillaceae bacterium]MBT6222080.1 septal ring lytic transglycosylase RlpA family protein [Rhodospirillaceae bacterium]MBT6360803.1 septal ring lytic transglycosylase RlpA family protein [Rhodospirillaceae bacterium]